ncbi:MAG: tetratricopeptide repeat protein [Planctomycetota bacterium]
MSETLPSDRPPSSSTNALDRLQSRPPDTSRYRVNREIARGGMGAILEVWDEDLHRHSAMKIAIGRGSSGTGSGTPVSELDPKSVARFLEEAQVTGQLEHPGIVPVHELGVDDHGQVYFTMRLVHGRTLEEVFTDAREGRNGWSTTRAVGALLKVCEAMAYAHSKGVLHRDLKPANVMVGEFGEVYVMDWGLVRVRGTKDRHDVRIAARQEHDERRIHVDPRGDESGDSDEALYTMDGDIVGTPSYMAPEQARGEIEALDERADIYSVGAMLYRLLAGRAPYQANDGSRSALDVLQALLAERPEPLGVAAPDAPAELAAVCERAMAPVREDRYPKMSALADDVRAFLENRVVSAYETGAWAEARKWMRRNRALAASIAAGLLALLAGLVTSIALKGRADESAREAVREARVADEVNSFLNDDLFASIDPLRLGYDVTVREVLDAASERLDGRFPDEPVVEASLRSTLGASYRRLGEYPAAEGHLRQSADLLTTELGAADSKTLLARFELARTLQERGRTSDALTIVEADLPIASAALGDESEAALHLMGARGQLLGQSGRFTEAAEQLARTNALEEKVYGPEHPTTLATKNDIALTLADLGDYEAATEILTEVVKVERRTLGDADMRTLRSINNLSVAMSRGGRLEEAHDLYRDAIERLAEAHGPDHPFVGEAMLNLGILFLKMERNDDADRQLQAARAHLAASLDEDHPLLLETDNAIAVIRSRQDRFEESLRLRRDTLRRQERALGTDHPDTIRSRSSLASVLSQTGRYEESREMHREVLEAQSRALGPAHPTTLITLENLGGLHFELGEIDEALAITAEVLDARRDTLGEEHPDVAKTIFNRAMVLRRAGKRAEALQHFEEAIEVMDVAFVERNRLTAEALRQLADTRLRAGDTPGALSAFEESLAVYESIEGEDVALGYVYQMTATCRQETGDLDGAIEAASRGLALRRDILGSDDDSTLSTMRVLFLCFAERGDFEDAEPLALEFHDRVETRFGSEHGNARQARALIVELYEDWVRPEEADAWRD